jgi:hypothetical protein
MEREECAQNPGSIVFKSLGEDVTHQALLSLEAHLEWRYRLRLSLLLSLRENGE